MSKFTIIRDKERCLLCLECVQVCPQSLPDFQFPVIVASESEPPIIANPDNCIECLLCYSACRAMAITLVGYHKVERLIKDEHLIREAQKMI